MTVTSLLELIPVYLQWIFLLKVWFCSIPSLLLSEMRTLPKQIFFSIWLRIGQKQLSLIMNSYLIFNSRFVSDQGMGRRKSGFRQKHGPREAYGKLQKWILILHIYSDQHCSGCFTAKGVYISKRILQISFSLKVLRVMKLFH